MHMVIGRWPWALLRGHLSPAARVSSWMSITGFYRRRLMRFQAGRCPPCLDCLALLEISLNFSKTRALKPNPHAVDMVSSPLRAGRFLLQQLLCPSLSALKTNAGSQHSAFLALPSKSGKTNI